MAFQYSKKLRSTDAIMPGSPSGTPTCRNILNCPAPSTMAASTRASGMERKNFCMINTGNAEKIPGRMIAKWVSIRESSESTR